MAAEPVGTFRWLVIDTVDPAALAPFWCDLLGVTVWGWFDDNFLCLTDNERTVPSIAFQRVPEPKSVKNRLHVDLSVADIDEAVARIEALGGSALSEVRESEGYRWRVMADPHGNEFCIAPRGDS
jgi:predicted enzyme related to lactoylglutathione lyase